MIESDLQFDFSHAVSAKRFDDESHGLSHCMKAVDFIVEENKRILFIEVKDFQHPRSPSTNLSQNHVKLSSGKLVNEELTPKCRDSFLYEYAMDNLGKPVYYCVLVALDTLTEPDLDNQANLLRKQIPIEGPPGNPWRNRFVHDCIIMNINAWNTHLPQYPVHRISQQNANI